MSCSFISEIAEESSTPTPSSSMRGYSAFVRPPRLPRPRTCDCCDDEEEVEAEVEELGGGEEEEEEVDFEEERRDNK